MVANRKNLSVEAIEGLRKGKTDELEAMAG